MTPHLRLLAFALAVLVLPAAPTAAHPGTTTLVIVEAPRPDVVDITLHMTASALITKLEDLGQLPLGTQVTDTSKQRARLSELTDILRQAVALRADGVAHAPVVTGIVVDDIGQAVVTMRLAAVSGVESLTWSTSLVYGSYPLAVRGPGARETVHWLQGTETSKPIMLAGTRTSRTSDMLRGAWFGFIHILPRGLDHILFIVGLFMLSREPRTLLIQVSAFTVAHSVTLALSLYGVASLPPGIVEPLIALSVAYVGVENFISSRVRPWRVAVVFGFGLLHGLGFAGVLADLGMGSAGLLSTLISFNVGVEAGQLTVLALCAATFYVLRKAGHGEWQRPLARLTSAAVGVVGLIWTIERVLS